MATLPFAFAWLLFFANATPAQNPVTWSIKANALATLKAGDKFTAQVTAQIQSGWHLYSITQSAGGPIPTRITLPDGQPFKLGGGVSGPRPRVEMDPNFQINTEIKIHAACKFLSVLVPRAGVESARPFGQRILSLKSLVTVCMRQFCSVRLY